MSEQLEKRIYDLETAATDLAREVGDGSELNPEQFDELIKSVLLAGEKLKTMLSNLRAPLIRRMKV